MQQAISFSKCFQQCADLRNQKLELLDLIVDPCQVLPQDRGEALCPRSAQTAIVTREAVLRMLDDLLARKPIAAEAARRQRLAAPLGRVAEKALPKATPSATATVTDR